MPYRTLHILDQEGAPVGRLSFGTLPGGDATPGRLTLETTDDKGRVVRAGYSADRHGRSRIIRNDLLRAKLLPDGRLIVVVDAFRGEQAGAQTVVEPVAESTEPYALEGAGA